MQTAIEKLSKTLSSTKIGGGYAAESGLRKQGIEVLGSGYFGCAAQIDGQVFKIYSVKDRGYDAFMAFCKRKHSVLLPKVKPVGQFGDWKVVQIEKLQSLEYFVGNSASYQLGEWCKAYCKRRVEAKYPEKHKLGGYSDGGRYNKRPYVGMVNYDNLIGLLNKMIDYAATLEGHPMRFDLHGSNFMVRDGNQLVITDPWAGNDC